MSRSAQVHFEILQQYNSPIILLKPICCKIAGTSYKLNVVFFLHLFHAHGGGWHVRPTVYLFIYTLSLPVSRKL